MTSSDELPELAARVRAVTRAFAQLELAVERGRPWPLSEDFGHTPESYWGPGETLAHVAEMLPFWTGELERVLDAPRDGPPVPFGRTADNPLRLAVIERDRTLPPRELFARISSSAERLAARLDELAHDDAAAARGIHPTLGEMSVAQLVSRFVTAHLEEHTDQLRRLLGTGSRAG